MVAGLTRRYENSKLCAVLTFALGEVYLVFFRRRPFKIHGSLFDSAKRQHRR